MRRLLLVLAVVSLVACEKKLVGPTPQVDAVAPGAVCQAQLSTRVDLGGAGLSPLLTGALAEGQRQLELPRVSLVPVAALDGAAVEGGSPVPLPDDPKTGEGVVRWTSQGAMAFTVTPALQLAPGLYDVQVQNANGATATLSQGLLAVPPPVLSRSAPDLVCGEQACTVVLHGTGFLRSTAGALPTVRIGAVELPPTAMEGCVALPGPAGYERCDALRLELPANTLALGTQPVTVTNPAPVNCASSEPVTLTVVPAPTVSAIASDLVCVAEGANTLTVTGTGFLTVDAATPVLRFRLGAETVEVPTAASGCEPVTGPAATVQRCTTLSATLPQAGLTPGAWDVSVTNPAPADCTSTQPVSFLVVPPPTVASAVPDVVCSAQGEVGVTLTGTGFLVIDGQAPTVDLGTSTGLAAAATDCTALAGSLHAVERCTTLTVSVPVAAAEGAGAVVVHNPAPAGCRSAEAVEVLVVSPPVLTSLAPHLACNADGAVAVTLSGTGFLTIDGATPTVDVGGTALPSSASHCAALPGSTRTVQRCTSLTISVPTTVAPGALAVTVTNPAPASCVSGAASLALFGRPAVSQVAPAGLCTGAGTTEIVVSGAGFLAVTSGTTRTIPTLTVGTQAVAVTTGACAAVTGVPDVEACGELRFSVSGTAFTPGVYGVTVTNPAPIGCASQPSTPATFTVTAPPTISSVQPAALCAGGDVLQLTGTGFLASSTVTLTSGSATVAASAVLVSAGGTSAEATFAGGLAPGEYTVRLANGATCSATATSKVTVIPGPQLFFVDPEVVFNGLTVQATVYGTGFTLPVADLALLPADGGAPISLPITNATQLNRAQVLMRNVDGGAIPAGRYAMALDDGANCDAVLADAVQVVDQTTLALRELEPPFGAQGVSTGVTVSADLAASADAGFLPVPRVYLNPSTPGPGTVASPLGAVAFVDPGTLTAVVPGTLPAGTYDVIVVNPDGRVGVRAQGFTVTSPSAPPPSISGLSPGSLPNNVTSPVAIDGQNFRAPVTVALRSCTDGSGVPTAAPTLTLTGTTATRLDASVSNIGSAAACIVRVTNTDNGTFADFASLVFTNASKNLYPAQSGPAMNVARRAPVVLGGAATSAARFVYAVGGDSGAGAGLTSVETSPLNQVGVPGPFFLQRQGTLTTPRTLAGGTRVGRWLYVAGGADGATRLNSVERAFILDPARRGEVVDLLLEPTTSGLASGLYYYRVAAVMGAGDAFNANGEELASDPFPVRLPVVSGLRFQVTVSWRAVPGAARYRVYRSPVAGAVVGAEEVIAEVSSGTQFKDTGAAPLSSERPLPVGSLGRWQTLGATLGVVREAPGVASAIDPVDPTKAYLYVLGGRQTNSTASNTYEYLPLTLNADGSQTPATAFVSGGTNTLSTARWQLSAAAATSEASRRIPQGTTYIYALSGLRPTNVVSQAADAAKVLAGGGLGTFVTLPNLGRAGYAAVVAADQVFAFGGNQAVPDTSVDNGEICGSDNTVGFCATNPTPPYVSNWNTGQTMNVARYLLGGTLQGAYIYVAGGTNGTAALATTEYRIW